MFGILRTFLALTVVVAHYGKWSDLRGANAVESFFIISGFMMTATIQKNYGFSLRGFLAFMENRFLRIFPLYWVAAGISLALISAFPQQSLSVQRNLVFPHSTGDWLSLAANWYWIPDFSPHAQISHVVPPAWALSVEFVMYVVLAVAAAANLRSGLLLLAIGSMYHLTHFNDVNARIYSVPAASLSYGLGVCIYFFSRKFQPSMTLIMASGALLTYMLVALNIHKVPLAGSGAPFYANMLLTAIVVCVCQWTPKGRVASFFDRQIGALSYPVYLTHYQVAVIVITIIGKPISGCSLFFAALPVLFLMATALEIANRQLVEPARDMIRRRFARADPA